MKTLNKNITDQVNFSHETLGPLAYLVHQMTKVGTFKLEAFSGKTLITSSVVEVSETSKKQAVYVDLDKHKGKIMPPIKLGKDGYVLFYNSKSFETYRILISNKKTIEFDSRKPKKGDIYSLNLLRPGSYELKSKSLKTSLNINTAYPSESNQKVQVRQSVKLSAASVKSKTTEKLIPNQGLNIELGDKFTDFEITFKKETKARKDQKISEHLKSKIQTIKLAKAAKVKKAGTVAKASRSKKKIIKKFSKTF